MVSTHVPQLRNFAVTSSAPGHQRSRGRCHCWALPLHSASLLAPLFPPSLSFLEGDLSTSNPAKLGFCLLLAPLPTLEPSPPLPSQSAPFSIFTTDLGAIKQSSLSPRDAERGYDSRRARHVPHGSISDDSHHVTEAIGDMYGDSDAWPKNDAARPLSFAPGQRDEILERRVPASHRFSMNPSNASVDSPLSRSISANPTQTQLRRDGSVSSNHSAQSPTPSLGRSPSSDTASQHFPLNDIDYESSPAAVAQELSNLQAIRRMSMNVDAADPDLPSFSTGFSVPSAAPTSSDDEDDASRLFWVPARLHPELAPKEFKTFVEDRVDRIRKRSGSDGESNSSTALERRGSSSSIGRRKSMLSNTIENPTTYKDGADVLERKRSSGQMHTREPSADTTLQELESLVNDPVSLVRKMSLDTSRRSFDTDTSEVPVGEDMPILPAAPGGRTLKRSTRTTYRKGSLREGKRVPIGKRQAGRIAEGDETADTGTASLPPSRDGGFSELTRSTTEPIPPSADGPDNFSRPTRRPSRPGFPPSTSLEDVRRSEKSHEPIEEEPSLSRPQPKQFHSRIASNGRTTAPLPGLVPAKAVPQITETPPPPPPPPSTSARPDRSSSSSSSHEYAAQEPPRRSVVTRSSSTGQDRLSPQKQSNQTLDDMASSPSPMPGTNTGTDDLSFIPTFNEDKRDKKSKSSKEDSAGRKSSWGWLLGDEKKKEDKEEKKSKSKASKMVDRASDSTRLDVLQTATDGPRGRESLVLDRDSLKLEEERARTVNRKSQESRKEKEPGIFSSIFGGKKKAEREVSAPKKTIINRALSPEPPHKTLRADIDYNWTRFSILEERAIYRMAHIKLANPRRALYSQVLLSNFMYSYLAKVQQMHPQIQIPAFVQKGQKKQPKQSDEYSQWQAYQEQERSASAPADDSMHAGSASAPFIDDYGPEHQQQEDANAEHYAQQLNGDGYYDSTSQDHWGDEQDHYSQQGLFDEERPPEDGDMW